MEGNIDILLLEARTFDERSHMVLRSVPSVCIDKSVENKERTLSSMRSSRGIPASAALWECRRWTSPC